MTEQLTDEFGNTEHEIRMVATAARARGDYEAERLALDRLAQLERHDERCRSHGPVSGDRCWKSAGHTGFHQGEGAGGRWG